MDEQYVAGAAYWRNPAEEPPPLGKKISILTRGGVQIVGFWVDGVGDVAWSPLIKITEENRKWMNDAK